MTLIDLDQALLDPASVFASPEAVLSHPDLEPSTRIAILKRWQLDAESLSVAEGEGMTGESSAAGMIQRVHRALDSLEASETRNTEANRRGES